MPNIEANPRYLIYFDNVRVDEFVKSWNVELSCNGNIGTASIDFLYLPQLAYTAAYVADVEKSESIVKMLGVIDNMTNVKIFVKNVFSGKYQMVFDGSIRGKTSTRAPQGNSLSFNAVDYTAWTNRTVAPIVIPYTQSTHPSDKFIWEAQGINVNKVMSVAQREIIAFKGKRLEEIINMVVTQALAANSIYADRRGVAYWDGIWDRMDLMTDIDPDILNKNVLDYIVSPNQGSVDTMYVLLNDIFSKLMLEFYQDKDGVIRIKPPFWNQPVLKSHIIDPVLVLSQSESTNYDNYVSRVVVTGGLDENFQTAGDFMSKLWTPTGCYLSDGTWETTQAVDGYSPGDTGSGGSSNDSSGGSGGTDSENNVGSGGGGSETSDFDYSKKNNGNVYVRKNGNPIVGFGNPSQYGSAKGNGVWWPSVGDGVRGHVQHLCSYYRKKLISGKQCVDPRFGGNSKTTKRVSGLSGTWASNQRYAKNIMAIINKMLGTNLSDLDIGTEGKAEYDKRVTTAHKQKVKDYFIRATEGRNSKLTGGITKSQFIDHYFSKCAEELIYPEVAVAQMCEETGHLTFGGSAVYQQNNYAGIGSTDGGNYTNASSWYWQKGGAAKARLSGDSEAYQYTYERPEEEEIMPMSANSRAAKKAKYVIVDAGHGGPDSGAVGGGLKEKDVTLALERMVVQILTNNGIKAYHSRTDDKDIGSVSSGKRVAKLKDDIKKRGHNISDYCLISIHADSAGQSAQGYHMLTNGGSNSKKLASCIREKYAMHVDWRFEKAGSKNASKRKDNHGDKWGLLHESDWGCGACIIETFFISNPNERGMWFTDDFPPAAAAGIASGIADFMNVQLSSTTVNGSFTDSTVDEKETDKWGSANTNGYNGTIFGINYNYDSVNFEKLLTATHEEMRYGGSVRQIDQPLIKFSNASAYYDMEGDNASATEVLKEYARFYMNMNNSLVNTSSVTMMGAPWLRPGFNIWLDPIYTDKVYYINSLSHSGSASGGVVTTLRLVHGRHRSEFLDKDKENNFGKLSEIDDNLFTKNDYFKSAKDFGPVVDSKSSFEAEKTNLMNIMSNLKTKGIVKAERSPYAPYYASDYGDSFLKTPTILKQNEAGKEIFTDEEWKEITGRTEVIDTVNGDASLGGDGDDGKESKSRVAMTFNVDDSPTGVNSRSFIAIKKGDKGSQVTIIQQWLNILDKAGINDDGVFGTATENAMKSFQKKRGLTVNGMYDMPTSETLNNEANNWNSKQGFTPPSDRKFINNDLLKNGKRGTKVKELQTYLNEFIDRGIITGVAKLPVTGNYLKNTEAVVRRYQTARNIKIDGIVGPETTAMINKDLASSGNSGGNNGVVVPPPPSGGAEGSDASNGKPNNTNPEDEKAKAKGRVTNVLFTGQYTVDEIGKALTDLYKNYAPGVVRQRSHVIEKGMNNARTLSNSMYVNNNYNKER